MNDGLNRSFYRETVRDRGSADGRVVREFGGESVYAHVQVTVRALERGQGIVFAWNAGSNIPVKFAPAVLEGIHKAASAGVSEKFELSDIHISVDDGSYHDVDSTLDAFREAAEKQQSKRSGSPIRLFWKRCRW
jgi:elongation factor G